MRILYFILVVELICFLCKQRISIDFLAPQFYLLLISDLLCCLGVPLYEPYYPGFFLPSNIWFVLTKWRHKDEIKGRKEVKLIVTLHLHFLLPGHCFCLGLFFFIWLHLLLRRPPSVLKLLLQSKTKWQWEEILI